MLQTQNYVTSRIFIVSPRIVINIIIIGSTALGGPWPPSANVTSDLYPGHPPANFYNPVSLRLPPPVNPS
jgi:hypothetical protein